MEIVIKKVGDLTSEEKDMMNDSRVREFGESTVKDYDNDFPKKTIFFFVLDMGKIQSFGGLRPVEINYKGKKYKIMGLCSVISKEKNKGYGRELIKAMIRYLKKKKLTGLGFCGKRITPFYEKCGLESIQDFILRFHYKNPVSGLIEIDDDGDGIYSEGEDGFIQKVINSKDTVLIDIPHW